MDKILTVDSSKCLLYDKGMLKIFIINSQENDYTQSFIFK